MRYYFYGLMKYISEHKEIQAGLIMLGGILAVIFVPLLIGSLSSWLFSWTIDGSLWLFGAMISVVIGVVGFIIFGSIYLSYLSILDKLQRRNK